MKKTLIILSLILGIVAIGAISVGVTLGQGSPQDDGTEIITTQDIGARITGNTELIVASFVPMLSKTDAISRAQEIVRTNEHLRDPETLPVKVTVAEFTGERNVSPYGFVTRLPVRVIVFDDYPASPRGGLTLGLEAVDTRYTVILDDETGEGVFAGLSGSFK